MTTRALLDENPNPTDEEIRTAISGSICRCTGYKNIVAAVQWAAEHEAASQAGGMSMATIENLPSTTQERPIGFGRLKRKEDARFIRGQGNYLDDIRLPGMVHGAILRSPFAHARILSIDTSRGARATGRGRGGHGQGPRDARARLDADDLVRHPGGARRRQGPLPGPGGRVRDRDRRVHRPRRAPADRRRVRAAARGGQRPQGARPGRAADPRRQDRPDRQPGQRDVGGRRRGGRRTARSRRPTPS